MKKTKKVLFVATEDQGHIMKFHLPYLSEFQKAGYEVHVACGGDLEIPYCDRKISIPIKRSPFRLSNLKAYFQLKRVIESEGYSLIHCHTPVGGVIGRLASIQARKRGTKVLYTAHGFHFYKGAPWVNWLIYYPVEKWLSRITDCVITINEEDEQIASSLFRHTQIERLFGMGIDIHHFVKPTREEKEQLRRKHHLFLDDYVLIFAGDLNKNKNQQLLIRAVQKVRESIPSIRLLLLGEGELKEEYRGLVELLGLENEVKILGFQSNMQQWMQMADVAVSSSKREGLPVNILEAMATGLPVIATDCRGNRELVKSGKNGYLVPSNSVEEFAEAIIRLHGISEEKKNQFSEAGQLLSKRYTLNASLDRMMMIYEKCLNDENTKTGV